jgi:transketolase
MPGHNSRILSQKIRSHCLNMVARAGASHIASALSIADLVAVLYSDILRFNPSIPSHNERDRLLLSKGHACTAIYAVLAEFNFFNSAELETYGADGSYLMNHISHYVPGVEFSAGALGHLLPVGAGKALFAKRNLQSWRTFVILSDGELNEGSNWEAIMFAAHHKLSNLVAIVDKNNYQSFTTTQNTLNMDPLDSKFQSFGWNVINIDGHDHCQINHSLSEACRSSSFPTVIIANTIKGKGVSFMENDVQWHYKTPTQDQLKEALAEVNI